MLLLFVATEVVRNVLPLHAFPIFMERKGRTWMDWDWDTRLPGKANLASVNQFCLCSCSQPRQLQPRPAQTPRLTLLPLLLLPLSAPAPLFTSPISPSLTLPFPLTPISTSAISYPWFCLPLALLAFALLAITSHTLPSGHTDAPASDQMRRSQTTKHWIVTRLGRRDFCIQIKRSSLSILAKHYLGLMQTFNWGITCITRDFYIHCIVLFLILYLVLNSGLRSEHQVVYLQWRFFIKLSWDKYWYAAPITMRSSQRNHLVRLKVKDFLLRLQLCRH